MSVFSEEDNQTVKIIGWTAVGFALLTVALVVVAMLVS